MDNNYYYIRNSIGSFFGFFILAGIVKSIFYFTTNQYEVLGLILGVIVMIVGAVTIGYLNTATASDIKWRKSLILHATLVFFMFLTDLTFGSSDFIFDLFRNIGLFVALQIGVLIYQIRDRKALVPN
ncbi:hypothetical protein GCM10025882_31950 [Acinetobacter gyllenbergii]|uniref:Uncharacterized protein n=1 Tax=Acinetobacter gyllenbergii CIP 110306 = MTCC 11365 TaxID=1217657 RepID=A0A829HD89_9GAMM|nr:hypothetical protein [Acinetobacter gyllenbergii]EPF72569.1 hypothetical protein F957_03705 [Acinetobacter gyllenbergii CIP 110306 = MTCC 11365]GMA12770.1 hypothetical protein GCM10025882_31950 [Acinetobacter gyllenbergii]